MLINFIPTQFWSKIRFGANWSHL